MKKFFSVLMVIALLAVCLVGCGSSAPSAPAAKEIDINAVLSAVEAKNAIANPREIDDFSIENDFGLNKDDVAEYVGKISNDQGNSGLVLVIKAAEGKAEDVKKALESYKTSQIAFFGNYPEFADGMAQVENGVIESAGDVVVIAFANTDGASYDDISSALTEALK